MECEKCGKTIKQEYSIGLKNKVFSFCSKKCADQWKKDQGLWKKDNKTHYKKPVKIPWLLVGGIILFVGMVFYYSSTSGARQILPAERFSGSAAESYKIAAEITDQLEDVPCFCGCMSHSGHRGLADCHRDTHSANCQVCQEETFEVYRLYKNGTPKDEIKRQIIEKFGRYS